jgi:hypothetical protein
VSLAARLTVPWWETEQEARAEDARDRLGDDAECDEAAERSVPGDGGW